MAGTEYHSAHLFLCRDMEDRIRLAAFMCSEKIC